MINSNDVGKFFTTTGEDIWQLMSYCSEPSATTVNIRTGERAGGAVSSLVIQPFIRLLPEKPIDGGKDGHF